MSYKTITVGKLKIGKGEPLCLISGPCVIESEEHALFTAEKLVELCEELGIPFIYKSSFDKANRSAYTSFRGPGLEKGLAILEKIKKRFRIPVTTDIHEPAQAEAIASVCDLIQIPAFLCRQTDLILASAATGAAINVKKGQFMAPWDMKNVVDKLLHAKNPNILLTDRGTSFGYNNLVTDMRSIPIMQSLGCPVCFDASHSVQLPGGMGNASGGQREYIPTLSKAAVAAGVDALFIESHPDPAQAKSDKDSVISLDALPSLLQTLNRLHKLIHENP